MVISAASLSSLITQPLSSSPQEPSFLFIPKNMGGVIADCEFITPLKWRKRWGFSMVFPVKRLQPTEAKPAFSQVSSLEIWKNAGTARWAPGKTVINGIINSSMVIWYHHLWWLNSKPRNSTITRITKQPQTNLCWHQFLPRKSCKITINRLAQPDMRMNSSLVGLQDTACHKYQALMEKQWVRGRKSPT